MTSETPMRMLEQMIDEAKHPKSYMADACNCGSMDDHEKLLKHLAALTLLRDKFQQAGKEIAELTDDNDAADGGILIDDVQRILGFAGAEGGFSKGAKGFSDLTVGSPAATSSDGKGICSATRKPGKDFCGICGSDVEVREKP